MQHFLLATAADERVEHFYSFCCIKSCLQRDVTRKRENSFGNLNPGNGGDNNNTDTTVPLTLLDTLWPKVPPFYFSAVEAVAASFCSDRKSLSSSLTSSTPSRTSSDPMTTKWSVSAGTNRRQNDVRRKAGGGGVDLRRQWRKSKNHLPRRFVHGLDLRQNYHCRSNASTFERFRIWRKKGFVIAVERRFPGNQGSKLMPLLTIETETRSKRPL